MEELEGTRTLASDAVEHAERTERVYAFRLGVAPQVQTQRVSIELPFGGEAAAYRPEGFQEDLFREPVVRMLHVSPSVSGCRELSEKMPGA